MYEISNPTAAPYSSVCYIECLWADGSATRASGVVIGANDVLTALHVVYDANAGGWARKVTIIPAADTQPWREPYGEFTDIGSVVGRAANWDLNGDGYLSQAESAGDLALIGLKSRIADVTGWLPAVQAPNEFSGVMAGYPARGTGLMAEQVFAAHSTSYGVYTIGSALGPGASGGPLLDTVKGSAAVTGVLSAGDIADTQSTYAGLFTAATWNWLQSGMWANDNLLGDNLPHSVTSSSGLNFSGSSATETVAGTAGRDSFRGNGGNDAFDGLAGTDTASFSGSLTWYTVSHIADTITVADGVAGRDGTDVLRNIERVSFSDLSLAFDVNGAAGEAYRLYQTVFNRAPEPAGLGYQMMALDNGLGLAQVADNFIHSPEFQSKFANLDDAAFVNQLYLYALDRTADPGGFAFYTSNLASGAETRADVVVGFSESPENQAALIGTMQQGMIYTV